MKKKVVIALAILLTVGSVTAGSIAMSNSSDVGKKPDKKIEVVSNKEDDKKQIDENVTDDENVLPEIESEETAEKDNNISATDDVKEEKENKTNSNRKEEKKDGKSKKSDVQKVSSTTTTSSKPATNKPSSSKPNKPSGNTNTNKPSKPSHTHNWVASTKQIHHDAIGHNERVKVKDAWIEKIPRYKDVAREICNTCEADITGNIREHIKKHMLAGEGGSHRTEYKKVFSHYEEVNHPAEYMDKWVVDKPAWTEKITSYHCSCGAKK